jgi:2-dehydro-3-deoxyglucarate aldolase
MRNTLRQALKDRVPTFGSWIQFGHTGIAEILAQAGFAWLVIDLEHTVIGIDAVQPLIQVIELSGCCPLVRLSANDPVQAKRVMDTGAHGVIVPAVNSAAEARRAVEAVKYPPQGTRGVGLARAQGYGARFAEYLEEADSYSIVIPMIEHRDAVEDIDAIIRTPGVDAIFVGPYDLSASYGVAGRMDHPLMRDAMARILKAAHAAGISPGLHVVQPPVSQVSDRIAEGFRFIAYGTDMLFLLHQARRAVEEIRSMLSP